jgi:hypothetical protein
MQRSKHGSNVTLNIHFPYNYLLKHIIHMLQQGLNISSGDFNSADKKCAVTTEDLHNAALKWRNHMR